MIRPFSSSATNAPKSGDARMKLSVAVDRIEDPALRPRTVSPNSFAPGSHAREVLSNHRPRGLLGLAVSRRHRRPRGALALPRRGSQCQSKRGHIPAACAAAMAATSRGSPACGWVSIVDSDLADGFTTFLLARLRPAGRHSLHLRLGCARIERTLREDPGPWSLTTELCPTTHPAQALVSPASK